LQLHGHRKPIVLLTSYSWSMILAVSLRGILREWSHFWDKSSAGWTLTAVTREWGLSHSLQPLELLLIWGSTRQSHHSNQQLRHSDTQAAAPIQPEHSPMFVRRCWRQRQAIDLTYLTSLLSSLTESQWTHTLQWLVLLLLIFSVIFRQTVINWNPLITEMNKIFNYSHTIQSHTLATQWNQGCRGHGYPWINPWIYPWIYPCVDIRLRLHHGYIHGYF